MNDIIKKMEELMANAKSENRDLNESEIAEFDALDAKLTSLKASEERALKLAELKASADTVQPEQRAVSPSTIKVGAEKADKMLGSEEHRVAFIKDLCGAKLTDTEKRALEAGVATEGGNVVATTFDTRVREKIRQLNNFRRLGAEVISTKNLVKIPVETTQPAAAVVAEEGSYGESDPAFGQLSLDAYKLGNIVKVSDELIHDNFINLEAHLIKKFSEAIAYKEEDLIISGAGSTETLGLLSTTSVGGVSVANLDFTGSGTAVTADELKTLKHLMKTQYRLRAAKPVWIMSANTFRDIALLKDADNRYLLNDANRGISQGDDEMLMGIPVIVSDHMNNMAEDTKSVILMDLSHYLIGDRTSLEIKRLDELYAATGQVGWRFSSRFDGLLTNGDAMVTGTNNAA